MEGRNTQHTVLVAEPEIAGVEGPADNRGETNVHEAADPTHNEQAQSLESPQPEVGSATPVTQPEEADNTPGPATQEENVSTSPPSTLGEGHPPRDDIAETSTPDINQEERTEPSIMDILEAE